MPKILSGLFLPVHFIEYVILGFVLLEAIIKLVFIFCVFFVLGVFGTLEIEKFVYFGRLWRFERSADSQIKISSWKLFCCKNLWSVLECVLNLGIYWNAWGGLEGFGGLGRDLGGLFGSLGTKSPYSSVSSSEPTMGSILLILV